MQAAARFGVPPSEYFEKWTERDRMLAESLIRLEAAVCSCGCGQPMELAHDPDTEGWWKVHEVQCMARDALEAAKPDDPAKDDPSVMRFAVLEDAYLIKRHRPPA